MTAREQPPPAVARPVAAAVAGLERVRAEARQLAGEVEGLLGGSASEVDRRLLESLAAVERSARNAAGALQQLLER